MRFGLAVFFVLVPVRYRVFDSIYICIPMVIDGIQYMSPEGHLSLTRFLRLYICLPMVFESIYMSPKGPSLQITIHVYPKQPSKSLLSRIQPKTNFIDLIPTLNFIATQGVHSKFTLVFL